MRDVVLWLLPSHLHIYSCCFYTVLKFQRVIKTNQLSQNQTPMNHNKLIVSCRFHIMASVRHAYCMQRTIHCVIGKHCLSKGNFRPVVKQKPQNRRSRPNLVRLIMSLRTLTRSKFTIGQGVAFSHTGESFDASTFSSCFTQSTPDAQTQQKLMQLGPRMCLLRFNQRGSPEGELSQSP